MTKAKATDDGSAEDGKTAGGAKKTAGKKRASRKVAASRKTASAKKSVRRRKVIDDGIDRETVRVRPTDLPLMEQHWGRLLFMHWPIPAERLRALVPPQLTIDTFDGEAWIGVAPFTMWDVRLSFTPPVPYLSAFHELNVRTYVLYNGVPGVWFFSLNTNSAMAVIAARTFYFLPYFNARIDLRQEGDTIHYNLRRTAADRPAVFNASWKFGKDLPESEPGTLEYFLTERYCLYAASGESIYRARIHHAPWPLQEATLLSHQSDIAESDYLPKLKGDPLVHYAESLAVDIWTPEKA